MKKLFAVFCMGFLLNSCSVPVAVAQGVKKDSSFSFSKKRHRSFFLKLESVFKAPQDSVRPVSVVYRPFQPYLLTYLLIDENSISLNISNRIWLMSMSLGWYNPGIPIP